MKSPTESDAGIWDIAMPRRFAERKDERVAQKACKLDASKVR